MLAQGLYRVRQFGNLFRARLSAVERRQVRGVLEGPELLLFELMPGMGQRHGLAVCQALRGRGCEDREVLAAALLHDVGKGRIHVGHRIAFVLLVWLAPGLLRWWAADHPWPGRRALYHCLHHAELGALLLEERGVAAGVVALVGGHESREQGLTDVRLALLQEADSAR